MKHPVIHKTIKIKKKIKAPLSKVYSAFSSPKARSKWAVPEGDAMEYSETDFRVGGTDRFRCGSPGVLEFKGLVTYQEIVKDLRIISTETLHRFEDALCVALLTTELFETTNGTNIVITAQVSSLNGRDMSTGYKQGWTSVLRNLEGFLEGHYH